MLSISNLGDPLFWAVFIGWVMSVVLHEFAHGVVALWGGDYTIRERGGLTLNPLQYVDPLMSIALPIVFLLLGGVPLPGGVTYVRRDLLRGTLWRSAVSAAGPAMNALLFVACALPLHPKVGWLDTSAGPGGWSNAQIALGALAVLQVMAVLLSLVPVPPLDGFGIVGPLIGERWETRLGTPPVSTVLFCAFFVVLWQSPMASNVFEHVITPLLGRLGYRYNDQDFFRRSFNLVLFGRSD